MLCVYWVNVLFTEWILQNGWHFPYGSSCHISLLRGLLDKEETAKLKHALEADPLIDEKAYLQSDGDDSKIMMLLWNEPRDDITGIVSRAEKVAGTIEKVKYLDFHTLNLQNYDF